VDPEKPEESEEPEKSGDPEEPEEPIRKSSFRLIYRLYCQFQYP